MRTALVRLMTYVRIKIITNAEGTIVLKKQWWLIVFLIISILGALTACSQQTNSKPAPRVPKKTIHLVALGDSLTYGVGDQQNNGGYVGQIKTRLQSHLHNQVVTSNYGVSGDRSDQILQRLDQQTQFQKDVKQADVIVMTVGGNDLLQTLEKELLVNSQPKLQTAIDQAGNTYQTKLIKLLRTIRQNNPQAPLFVFSIYDPVYTYFPTVTAINDSIEKWNQITKTTLAKYPQTYFVDINHQLSYGQYQTKASRQKLVKVANQANRSSISQAEVVKIMDGKGKNLNRYISTADNFHPNHAGYRLMTKALYQKMLKHNDFMYQERK